MEDLEGYIRTLISVPRSVLHNYYQSKNWVYNPLLVLYLSALIQESCIHT